MNQALFADPIYVFLVIAGVSLLPLIAVMATSYTKIVVVISLLRNALGLQNVPPPTVTNGLAVVLSVFVMYPTFIAAYGDVEKLPPNVLEDRRPGQLFTIAGTIKEPLRAFLVKNSGDHERRFFSETARRMMPEKARQSLRTDDLVLLVPAFALTELTEAFEVGFLLFLPFVVIDMVVATVLMAMGMQMMSPTTLSLPFKVLLFVILNGWERLFSALLYSY
ncbi:type III secretion protein R [Noviherbaspirillum humi]|uniref:Type III secretion protein R n=1 Tax=Noviherbaspirillum humi TaxID=1688639 RepID=A0A239JXD5_9BURK|nr:type III secretion system export apparatus subunit SctR [Noviherbaspirillum humi]SNT10551.1 type III secretion protein R [Noviherbaspirillum humi]